jgi:hypothetical protein
MAYPSNSRSVPKEHDLGGENVLISETFAYFGSKPIAPPPELECFIAGRGHRCHFSDDEKAHFLEFVSKSKFGVHAPPRNWPKNDDSWKSAAGGKR